MGVTRATNQRRSAEDVALDLLQAALMAEPPEPGLDEVVARIRAAASNPAGLRLSSGSLVDALAEEDDAQLDVAAWRAAWSAVEADMATIERADAHAEGMRAR